LPHLDTERGSIFPPDGLQVARTEKPNIPYRIFVGGHPRDGALSKPDHDKRVMHEPRFTILPGFLRPAELTILGVPEDLPDVGLGGPWINLACLVQDLRGTGAAEDDSGTQDGKRSLDCGSYPMGARGGRLRAGGRQGTGRHETWGSVHFLVAACEHTLLFRVRCVGSYASNRKHPTTCQHSSYLF
jgi:hypothetical protein